MVNRTVSALSSVALFLTLILTGALFLRWPDEAVQAQICSGANRCSVWHRDNFQCVELYCQITTYRGVIELSLCFD